MRRVTLCAILAAAACGPKVDPRNPFDDDDPRAGAKATPVERLEAAPAPVAAEPVVAPAPPGTGVREGTIDRATLKAVLDAGPGKVLESFEVTVQEQQGNFVGWRLVRFLPTGKRFTILDLAPGDVLLAVNRRPIVKPADLTALWTELYRADAIVLDLRRDNAPFTIRFAITGAPAPAGAGSATPAPAAAL